MAISLDGYIAGRDGDTNWVLDEEYKEFWRTAKKYGNAIYGRRTYDGDPVPLEGALNVIVTHHPLKDYRPYHFTDRSPREILRELEDKGYKTALVCGGGDINGLFAKEGLIDEVYLDVEPVVLGEGIPLFGKEKLKIGLKFLETNRIGTKTVQLHYKVIK